MSAARLAAPPPELSVPRRDEQPAPLTATPCEAYGGGVGEQGDVAPSRVLTLPADPRVVSRARRFLRHELATRGAKDLQGTAELLTSELVTNVLLHTRSSVTVRVTVHGDSARIEVEDDSPIPPVAGVLDMTAACGRGFVLVARLSQRWGVSPIANGGKKVWFEVGASVPAEVEEPDLDELLDLWGDDRGSTAATEPATSTNGKGGAPREPGSREGTRRVRIDGIDTDLLNATKSHLDELIRDLTLATEAPTGENRQQDDLLALGVRLHTLAVDLLDFRNQIRRQALDAAQERVPTLNLDLDLPVALRPRLIDYRDALDLADQYCAAERLLLAPAPTEHVRFRRWKLDRIIEQLRE
jgi:anti-sigma regulatory factor (Ser/Thr protein kinase)